jgi:hypothetical protein
MTPIVYITGSKAKNTIVVNTRIRARRNPRLRSMYFVVIMIAAYGQFVLYAVSHANPESATLIALTFPII